MDRTVPQDAWKQYVELTRHLAESCSAEAGDRKRQADAARRGADDAMREGEALAAAVAASGDELEALASSYHDIIGRAEMRPPTSPVPSPSPSTDPVRALDDSLAAARAAHGRLVEAEARLARARADASAAARRRAEAAARRAAKEEAALRRQAAAAAIRRAPAVLLTTALAAVAVAIVGLSAGLPSPAAAAIGILAAYGVGRLRPYGVAQLRVSPRASPAATGATVSADVAGALVVPVLLITGPSIAGGETWLAIGLLVLLWSYHTLAVWAALVEKKEPSC